MTPDETGEYYFCVKTPLSPEGEVYLWADTHEVVDGALVFRSEGLRSRLPMTFAAGSWSAVFAASTIDGHAIAVEIWEGEVNR